MALEPAVARHVGGSYPHNNDYRVVGRRVVAKYKLWRRRRVLLRHYPRPLESLLDVSCSTGYFTLEAAGRASCRRAHGIDVDGVDLEAARSVARYLGSRARFDQERLHEVAEHLEDRGGAYQLVLLLNAYPYLLMGSHRDERRYDSHEVIFEALADVCGDRLLFSNRVELSVLPRNMQARAAELGIGADEYCEGRIRAAAERRFRVEDAGRVGRIPLWILSPRRPARP